MKSPRIPQDEVEDVVARAAELAAAEQRAAAEASAGASEADVKQAAREAGIDPVHVERALAERRERTLRLRRGMVLRALCLGALAVLAAGLFALRAVARWVTADGGGAEPAGASVDAPGPGHDRSAEGSTVPEPDGSAEGSAVPEPDGSAEGSAVAAEPPRVGVLVPTLLSGQAAAAAADALEGDWQLASWLSLGSERLEVPARRRAETEPPVEAWQMLSSGRFRRSFSDGLAAGGRWSVAGTVPAPEGVAWLGIDTWWLVALDDVTLSYDPLAGRGREWALVARDGEEAVFVYLGKSADASAVTLGGRFTRR
jgi:hypothetical protein